MTKAEAIPDRPDPRLLPPVRLRSLLGIGAIERPRLPAATLRIAPGVARPGRTHARFRGRGGDVPPAAAALAGRPPGGGVCPGRANGNALRLDLRRRQRPADAAHLVVRRRAAADLVAGRAALRLCLGEGGRSGHLHPRPRERARGGGALVARNTGLRSTGRPTARASCTATTPRPGGLRSGSVSCPSAGAKPGSTPESPPFSEYAATYSPDGRWLALVSEEADQPEVYVASADGKGVRRRVSSAGGEHPRWRRDGRELYYLDGGGRLIAVPVSSGPSGVEVGAPQVLFTAGAAAIDFDVTASGRPLPVSDGDRSPASIRRSW